MNSIGGNITAHIQVKAGQVKDRMGKPVYEWVTVIDVVGFLDLMNGDSHYTNYNTKLQESTHVFICDYFPLSFETLDARLLIDGKLYDLKLVDDPMGMHEHYEMFLQFVG